MVGNSWNAGTTEVPIQLSEAFGKFLTAATVAEMLLK